MDIDAIMLLLTSTEIVVVRIICLGMLIVFLVATLLLIGADGQEEEPLSELPNFPMVNQLDMNDTTDGRPAENAGWDCVPASICAGLIYLTGVDYDPDTLKDAVYGEAWVNEGTSVVDFVPYCVMAGVTLAPIETGSTTAAVARAHQELAAGRPVIFTQQDDYAPSQPTWTHVCVWYKDSPGFLTAMDPYGGFALTYSDADWGRRLRSGELWTMERITSMKFDAIGWLDAAIEIDALNKSMDRAGYNPVIIVIHGTAGFSTAQDVGNYFANTTVQASTHFVVGKDGAIVQCVNVAAASWGNGGLTGAHKPFLPAGVNPNFYTISIEHVKNHVGADGQPDNMDILTDAQKKASFQLLEVLCSTYNIPRKIATDMRGGLLGHCDIDPVNRARCPGPYPWDEAIAFLNQKPGGKDMDIHSTFAAAHFQQVDAGKWYCPEKKMYVMGDILKFYCKVWGAPRLPTSGEITVGKYKYQEFECGIICFDPEHVHDHPTDDTCYMLKLTDPIVRTIVPLGKVKRSRS